MDAAAVAFARKGLSGASTRDIADRLNIRQAELSVISSKDAALAAVCERASARLHRRDFGRSR